MGPKREFKGTLKFLATIAHSFNSLRVWVIELENACSIESGVDVSDKLDDAGFNEKKKHAMPC